MLEDWKGRVRHTAVVKPIRQPDLTLSSDSPLTFTFKVKNRGNQPEFRLDVMSALGSAGHGHYPKLESTTDFVRGD